MSFVAIVAFRIGADISVTAIAWRARVCVANFRSRDCPRGLEIFTQNKKTLYIYEDFKM